MPALTPGAARMSAIVDMRQRGPEPPWAGPEIEFKPGMAREMLRELAPLLAEEGIHAVRTRPERAHRPRRAHSAAARALDRGTGRH